MITVFVHDGNTYTVSRLLETAPVLSSRFRFVTYGQIFARRSAPFGTLVFTDFDLLHAVEIDMAAEIADKARSLDPATRIVNHPAFVLERVPLLAQLFRAGLNPVEVVRLDTRDMPERYPVFIRSEDGAYGPESGLIEDEVSLVREIEAAQKAGRTMKRRIAVSFAGSPDNDGYFRKYGAFVIGDRIIPQHILRNTGWNVKSAGNQSDPAFAAEEETYVENNPHEAHLLNICKFAGIEFGRIDYTLVDGAPVIFEINTNPTFPRFVGGEPGREKRRSLILQRLTDALDAIDTPASGPAWFRFESSYGMRKVQSGSRKWYSNLPYSLLEQRRWSKVIAKLTGSRSDK